MDVPLDDPRLRHDLVPNDPAARPPFGRSYSGLPVLPLPRELPEPGVSATAALDGAEAARPPLDAAQLGPDRLDDRTYRDAQLAAGLVEGRLHPAAYALDASASGMTLIDED